MTLQWKRLNYLLREILRLYQETKKKKRMNELLRWTKRSVYMFLCKYNLSSSAPFQLLAPGYIRVICSEGSRVLQPAAFLPLPPHAVTAGGLRVSLEVSTL